MCCRKTRPRLTDLSGAARQAPRRVASLDKEDGIRASEHSWFAGARCCPATGRWATAARWAARCPWVSTPGVRRKWPTPRAHRVS